MHLASDEGRRRSKGPNRRGVSRDLLAFVIDRNDDRNFGAIGPWLHWNQAAANRTTFRNTFRSAHWAE